VEPAVTEAHAPAVELKSIEPVWAEVKVSVPVPVLLMVT
jgi:hypothetical protein